MPAPGLEYSRQVKAPAAAPPPRQVNHRCARPPGARIPWSGAGSAPTPPHSPPQGLGCGNRSPAPLPAPISSKISATPDLKGCSPESHPLLLLNRLVPTPLWAFQRPPHSPSNPIPSCCISNPTRLPSPLPPPAPQLWPWGGARARALGIGVGTGPTGRWRRGRGGAERGNPPGAPGGAERQPHPDLVGAAGPRGPRRPLRYGGGRGRVCWELCPALPEPPGPCPDLLRWGPRGVRRRGGEPCE